MRVQSRAKVFRGCSVTSQGVQKHVQSVPVVQKMQSVRRTQIVQNKCTPESLVQRGPIP
jgi:hypothetical protein